MKTADELYNDHKEDIGGFHLLDRWNFQQAIAERDNEWKEVIQKTQSEALKLINLIRDAIDKETNWQFKEKLEKHFKEVL